MNLLLSHVEALVKSTGCPANWFVWKMSYFQVALVKKLGACTGHCWGWHAALSKNRPASLSIQVHSYNTRNSNTFYLFHAWTNVRLFGIRFQGAKFFNALNHNRQGLLSVFLNLDWKHFSLPDSALVNNTCFFLIFVCLVCFVLLAFYLNLCFNMISVHICYIHSLRLGGSSCNRHLQFQFELPCQKNTSNSSTYATYMTFNF